MRFMKIMKGLLTWGLLTLGMENVRVERDPD